MNEATDIVQTLTSLPAVDHPEFWRARGIGSETGLICLVTGQAKSLMPNISGFVASYEAGERVVAMFGGRAWLDYRPSEPNWVQVKVGVLPEHLPVLTRLMDAMIYADGVLRVSTIIWAIQPEESPGYRPYAMKFMDVKASPETIRNIRYMPCEVPEELSPSESAFYKRGHREAISQTVHLLESKNQK